jgi:glycosyltransferase involved in cell wall biosynthesis
LIPCYNEEVTIQTVVRQFRAALPDCHIYVYDNNSADRTIERAEAAGAIVRRERLQGKGNVVRRMLADIDADVYFLVDGDATYDAAAAPAMFALLHRENLDMVNGTRITEIKKAYRPGHRLGNVVLTWLVRATFGTGIADMLGLIKQMHIEYHHHIVGDADRMSSPDSATNWQHPRSPASLLRPRVFKTSQSTVTER